MNRAYLVVCLFANARRSAMSGAAIRGRGDVRIVRNMRHSSDKDAPTRETGQTIGGVVVPGPARRRAHDRIAPVTFVRDRWAPIDSSIQNLFCFCPATK